MAIDLHEYKKLYLQTSQELLKKIQDGVSALKENPTDMNTLSEVHRAAHSLKSQSLVMGYTQIGLAGRILEALFLNIKDGKIEQNSELTTLVESALTAISTSLAGIREGHGEKNLSSHISAIENNTEISLLAE